MDPKIYTEADWKLLRKRLPGWQENYMQGLLDEYAAILASGEKASAKFWALEERLRIDRRDVGVNADMRRSRMVSNLSSLLREGAITLDDLEGFSEPLRKPLTYSYTLYLKDLK